MKCLKIILIMVFIFSHSSMVCGADKVEADSVEKMAEVVVTKKYDQETQSWELEVVPYFWYTSFDVKRTDGAVTVPMSLRASEVYEDLEKGGNIIIEIHKDKKWIMTVEGAYMYLEGSEAQAQTVFGEFDIEVDSKIMVVEYLVGRRYGQPHYWVEVVAGGRRVEVDALAHTPMGEEERSSHWNDAVIASRASFALTNQVTLGVRGSVADPLNSSERTYDTSAHAQWKPTKIFALDLGYRHLKLKDKEHDSSLELTLDGPYLAFRFLVD